MRKASSQDLLLSGICSAGGHHYPGIVGSVIPNQHSVNYTFTQTMFTRKRSKALHGPFLYTVNTDMPQFNILVSKLPNEVHGLYKSSSLEIQHNNVINIITDSDSTQICNAGKQIGVLFLNTYCVRSLITNSVITILLRRLSILEISVIIGCGISGRILLCYLSRNTTERSGHRNTDRHTKGQ